MNLLKSIKKEAKKITWEVVLKDIGFMLLLIAASFSLTYYWLAEIPEERVPPIFFLLIILTSFLVLGIDKKTKDITNIKKLISEPPIKVYEDHADTNTDLKKYIEDVRPHTIYMIEYSAWSVQTLIDSLIKTRTSPDIYLLIQHPKEGESISGQKNRIWGQITEILSKQDEFKNYPNLKILCYKQRTSFRGRNFDNKLINIGWYIYKYEKNGEQRVHGHNQPTITFRERYEGFFDIKKMFNDTFENLWEHGISLNEVSDEYKDEIPLCSDPNFIKWCERVSPKENDKKIEIKR